MRSRKDDFTVETIEQYRRNNTQQLYKFLLEASKDGGMQTPGWLMLWICGDPEEALRETCAHGMKIPAHLKRLGNPILVPKHQIPHIDPAWIGRVQYPVFHVPGSPTKVRLGPIQTGDMADCAL